MGNVQRIWLSRRQYAIVDFCALYGSPRFVTEWPEPQRQFFWYEKLDHFHFGTLFSGDNAGFVREHSKFI
jgi:hypothetical protein